MGNDDDDELLDGWKSGDFGHEDDNFGYMLCSSTSKQSASRSVGVRTIEGSSATSRKGSASAFLKGLDTDIVSIDVPVNLTTELSKHIQYENELLAQLEKARQDYNEVIQISSVASDYKKDQVLRVENRKLREEVEALQKQVATLESSLRKRTKVEGDTEATTEEGGESQNSSKVTRADLISSLAAQGQKQERLQASIEKMKKEVANSQRLKRAIRLQMESCKSHIRKQDGVIASNADLIKQQRAKIQSYCRKLEEATAEKDMIVRRKNVEIEHLRVQLQMKSFMVTAPVDNVRQSERIGPSSGAKGRVGSNDGSSSSGSENIDGDNSSKQTDLKRLEALTGADTIAIARLARKLSQQAYRSKSPTNIQASTIVRVGELQSRRLAKAKGQNQALAQALDRSNKQYQELLQDFERLQTELTRTKSDFANSQAEQKETMTQLTASKRLSKRLRGHLEERSAMLEVMLSEKDGKVSAVSLRKEVQEQRGDRSHREHRNHHYYQHKDHSLAQNAILPKVRSPSYKPVFTRSKGVWKVRKHSTARKMMKRRQTSSLPDLSSLSLRGVKGR